MSLQAVDIGEQPTESAPIPPRIKSVPVRSYGQIVAAVIVAIFVVAFIVALARNKNLDWGIVFSNITAGTVLHGLVVTIELSVVSMFLGILFGTLVAVARLSNNRLLSSLAAFYIWFFRGIPLLAQVLIWGNFALLFPRLGIGIPFTDIQFVSVETNAVLTTFVAAVIALALHETSYMAEVVRSGIIAVPGGQKEAASALGLRGGTITWRIVLPQALRVIIPPTGNQFISLIKSSSLVSVIAGGELMTAVTTISAVNYRTIELLLVAAFWYLVIVSVLSIGQRFLERRASRGYAR